MSELEKIKLNLKQNLSKYRYEHSLRVAKEASNLAKHYKVNDNEAYLSGLLHDVAKEFNNEENNKWTCQYSLSVSSLTKDNSKTIHAEIGALVAKKLYKVNANICQAIKYHTLGNINMNLLDKIVFIADKIETGKNYPLIEKIRILAYEDIDKALILYLQSIKIKLEKENKKLNKELEKLLKHLITKNTSNDN